MCSICRNVSAASLGGNGAKTLLTKPIDFKTLRSKTDMRSNALNKLLEFAAVHESAGGPLTTDIAGQANVRCWEYHGSPASWA
jgi:hypothetical protein